MNIRSSRISFRGLRHIPGRRRGLPWLLFHLAPPSIRESLVLAAFAGLAIWSVTEYAMHRLVFHGIEPFQRMHLENHRRPRALIATPTVLGLAMIAGLFWLPAILLAGRWLGSASALGLTAGYRFYGIVHHALHHWRAGGALDAQNASAGMRSITVHHTQLWRHHARVGPHVRDVEGLANRERAAQPAPAGRNARLAPPWKPCWR